MQWCYSEIQFLNSPDKCQTYFAWNDSINTIFQKRREKKKMKDHSWFKRMSCFYMLIKVILNDRRGVKLLLIHTSPVILFLKENVYLRDNYKSSQNIPDNKYTTFLLSLTLSIPKECFYTDNLFYVNHIILLN